MRQAITTVALALCLGGCVESAASVEPFELATSWEPGSAAGPACRPGWWVAGELVIDPKGGTAINVEDGDYVISKGGHRGDTIQVLWWPTFTARRSGTQVSVIGPGGNVVAMTGRRYRIVGSYELIGFVACGDEVTRE